MATLSTDSKVALGVLFLVILSLAGWAETYTRSHMSANTPLFDPTPYGTITAIKGDTVIVTMEAPFQQQSVQYTLTLTASTTVTRHHNKTPEEFNTELAAFRSGQASSSPLGFTSSPASQAELKVGMLIEAPGAVPSAGTWTATSIIIDADSAPTTSTLVQ